MMQLVVSQCCVHCFILSLEKSYSHSPFLDWWIWVLWIKVRWVLSHLSYILWSVSVNKSFALSVHPLLDFKPSKYFKKMLRKVKYTNVYIFLWMPDEKKNQKKNESMVGPTWQLSWAGGWRKQKILRVSAGTISLFASRGRSFFRNF